MKLPELPGYQYDELIGEGAFGVAVRCTFEGRETRVVKFLKAQSINPGLVSSCIRALSGKERHPGIAEVYQYNFSEYPYFYIMPFFGERDPGSGNWQGRSLDHFIGDIQGPDGLGLIDQLASALAFAHRLDVIHGGLNPANIFLNGTDPEQWQLKLADWGQGYLTGLQYLEMGDLGFYASPEQLDNGDPSHGAGKRWDVYAFGVVAFLLLTGRFPRLDNQHQAYLREIQGFSHVPAAAFGTVLDQPEKYVDWIVEEERIIWPNPPSGDSETKRREVIERCLAVDPRQRFSDMRDVVAALDNCDHQLELLEVERKATEGRHRVLKRTARWQKAAAAAAIASLVGAAGAAFFFAEWRMAEKEIDETREGAEQHVQQLQSTMASTQEEREETEKLLEAYKAQSEDMREQMHEEMLLRLTQARDLLVASQENGDRFFELVLNTRDSDVPGFALERQKALLGASRYYESLLKAYGDSPDYLGSSAKAAQYLGEIQFALGEVAKSEADFLSAKEKFEKHFQSANGDEKTAAIRGLAEVNHRLAEIAKLRKQPEIGLVAIEAAVNFWLRVPMGEGEDIEPAVRTGDALILQAELNRQLGRPDSAMKGLQDALKVFLNLREKHRDDHRVVGGLAKTIAATGDLMRLSGDTDGALETYQQAAEYYADAIQLNGANHEYQLGFAITLAEVAIAEDDVEKLTAAAAVLGQIAQKPENRHRIEVFTALADCYGALAHKQRDGNQPASAIEWETKAIAFLEPMVADGGPGAAEELRFALAERKCSLANLQSDRGSHPESRDTLRSANTLIERLLTIDGTNPQYRRLYAQAQGQLGYASIQAGDKDAARRHYETARGQWEAYLSANPQDDQAVQALEWVKTQLSGLT